MQPSEWLGGQKPASMRVRTDAASEKPRQDKCVWGFFSNVSWHTGYGFDFTTTSQALLTFRSQQLSTK